MTENAFILKNYNWIKTNKQKTVFFNEKTGRYINVNCNSRCYGIWISKGKFLSLSKMEIEENYKQDEHSEALTKLINDLKKI